MSNIPEVPETVSESYKRLVRWCNYCSRLGIDPLNATAEQLRHYPHPIGYYPHPMGSAGLEQERNEILAYMVTLTAHNLARMFKELPPGLGGHASGGVVASGRSYRVGE